MVKEDWSSQRRDWENLKDKKAAGKPYIVCGLRGFCGRVLFYRLVSSVRHKRHITGEFDRVSDLALMLVAKLVSSG